MVLLAATAPGLARAERGPDGAWRVTRVVPGARVEALAADPRDRATVWAGLRNGGAWRSCDRGRTWSPAGLDGVSVKALAVDPSDADVVVAGVKPAGVWRTEDGGATWRELVGFRAARRWWWSSADPPGWVPYVSAAPIVDWHRPGRMPLAHHDGHAQAGIYRAGGGGRWERLAGGLPQPLGHMPYALVTDPERPGHVFAGLAHGQVWHSSDHGDAWTRLPIDLGGVRRAMVLA